MQVMGELHVYICCWKVSLNKRCKATTKETKKKCTIPTHWPVFVSLSLRLLFNSGRKLLHVCVTIVAASDTLIVVIW